MYSELQLEPKEIKNVLFFLVFREVYININMKLKIGLLIAKVFDFFFFLVKFINSSKFVLIYNIVYIAQDITQYFFFIS